MAYTASARPSFDQPTHIPFESATRHLWGDLVSGEVADWIYVSSDKIHQLVFGMAPGGASRHSDDYRTVFAADELLYVLNGVMAIANPDTGEVHRVRPGEAAFFRRDAWHPAFNQSTEPLRVLELFAPPPSQGTSGWLVNILDPEAIIIGGGLRLAGGQYWTGLVESTCAHIWTRASRDLPIIPAALGSDAGVVGAALAGARRMARAGKAPANFEMSGADHA